MEINQLKVTQKFYYSPLIGQTKSKSAMKIERMIINKTAPLLVTPSKTLHWLPNSMA